MIFSNTKTVIYAISILTLILLIPVGVDSSMAQEQVNLADSSIGKLDPYLEILKQEEFYQDMTDDQKSEYVQGINEFRENQNPYQGEVQELVDMASQIALDLKQAQADGDIKRIQSLEAELFALLENLKTYGAVTSEELEKNPSYWAQRAKNASDAIDNNNAANSVCHELDEDLECGGQAEMYASLLADGIIPIPIDVILENKADVWFPITELPIISLILLLGIISSLILVLYRRRSKTSPIQDTQA